MQNDKPASPRRSVAIDMKLQYLKTLEEDLSAAYSEMMNSTSEVERIRVQRQIDDLEQKIAQVKKQLDDSTGLEQKANESQPRSQSGRSDVTRSQEDTATLQRQLVEERVNLKLIEERMTEYVLGVDVPLQLVKEQRRLQDKISQLRQQLGE